VSIMQGGSRSTSLVALRSCDLCGVGCLHGYHPSATGEDVTRHAWREAVETASADPSLSILMGAAFGSVFCEALGVPGFRVHVHGRPGTGRTLAIRAAVASAGDPEAVVRPSTPENAAHRIRSITPLPVAFDDPDGATEEVIEGKLRDGIPGVVLTTGTDLRPGAVNLGAPLGGSRGALLLLHLLVVGHHGWPVSWIEDSPIAGELRTWFSVARDLLLSRTPVSREQAVQLALASVGFGAIGRLAGRGFAFYAGMGAAQRIAAGGLTNASSASRPVLRLV